MFLLFSAVCNCHLHLFYFSQFCAFSNVGLFSTVCSRTCFIVIHCAFLNVVLFHCVQLGVVLVLLFSTVRFQIYSSGWRAGCKVVRIRPKLIQNIFWEKYILEFKKIYFGTQENVIRNWEYIFRTLIIVEILQDLLIWLFSFNF